MWFTFENALGLLLVGILQKNIANREGACRSRDTELAILLNSQINKDLEIDMKITIQRYLSLISVYLSPVYICHLSI